MKKPNKILCMASLLAMSLFAAIAADAQTIYCVRPGASGANTGADWNNAFTQLPSSLKRGAIYYLAAGSYGSRTFSDAESGTNLIIIRKASAADPGTSVGWQAAYASGPAIFNAQVLFHNGYYTLDGASRTDWQTGYGIVVNNGGSASDTLTIGDASSSQTFTPQHVTLRYVEVIGSFSRSGTPADPGIECYWGAGYVTVQYCTIHDTGCGSFMIRGTSNLTIEQCYVARNTSSTGCHGEAIGFSDATTQFTVRNNWFEDIEGTAFFSTPSGQTPTSVNNVYFYGNVFDYSPTNAANPTGRWGTGDGCLYILGCTTTGDFFVYNNDFINLQDSATHGTGGYFGSLISLSPGWPTAVTRLYVKNNIFYNCDATQPSQVIQSASDSIADFEWNNNYYINTATTDSDPNKVTSTKNPFVNWSAGNFGLTGPMPTGLSLPAPFNVDMNGTVRGSDGVWDAGAVEFGGTAPPPSPTLTLSAVTQSASDVDPTTSGIQVYEGTIVQYSATATESGANTLTWQWSYTTNGSSQVVYLSGTGAVTPISVSYPTGTGGKTYVWTLTAGDGTTNLSSQVTTSVEVPPAPQTGLTFLATQAATVTSPLAIASGSLSQTTSTMTVASAGEAMFNFNITNAGNYVIQALGECAKYFG